MAPSPAKYRQIAGDLRARIEAGEYPVDSQLPTKPALIKSYNAALGTIDKALAVLRDLGMIESRQGMGTFVIRQRPEEAQRDAGGDLASRVDALELNLADLYGKLGYDYPREHVTEEVAHERRA